MKITTIALRRSGDEDSFLVYKEHTPLEGACPTGVALYSEIFDFFEDDFSEREMKHGTAFTSTKEMIQYLEGEDIGYVRVANLTITETAHWLKKCGEEFKATEDCMETCNGEPCPNGMECEPHPDDESPLTKAWNAGYKQGQEDLRKAGWSGEWSEPQHCGGCEEVVRKQGPRVYFQ